VLAAVGCSSSDQPVATHTVTTTATTTATATATVTITAPAPVIVPRTSDLPRPTSSPLPRIGLTVFEDGCGVVRTATDPGAYRNLTWTFRDADGFEVLGRNAEGELRYRYFRPGTYSVVLEAWHTDHYAPVSNRVTVRC
jgi:hypothetical protein